MQRSLLNICSPCKMKHLCAVMQNLAVRFLSRHATAMCNIIRRSGLKATVVRHKHIVRQMEHGLKGCGGI
jgi:hypothetical protein